MKSLSIIIPIFNEAESLPSLFKELKSEFGNSSSVEIVFVNDGSTDSSQQSIERAILDNSTWKMINLYRNYGKSVALQAGIECSSGEIIGTLDADLQDDPKEIAKLIDLSDKFDLVVGWKKNRLDPLEKRIASKIFNFFIRVFSGLKIKDSNTGIKIFKREVAESLNLYGGRHRYIPLLAHQKNFSVGEVAVNHRKRKFGDSKYGSERYKHGFFDFLTILFLGKYMDRPLHFFGMIGFITILSGISAEFYVLYLKYFLQHSFQQHIAMIIFGSLLIITGVQLFTFGLVGEIIVNKNQKTKNFIKEIIE
ncbi:MAG: glycosyltransferase family 2 protein [Candidatus Marinimicrobia bacterium]|jgi:glycosyltransferase involved in cell wall biosynthesis|nr:glycosyltransferase family 2 protein [Candidatus Neomarinimicrobiota bacterium]